MQLEGAGDFMYLQLYDFMDLMKVCGSVYAQI